MNGQTHTLKTNPADWMKSPEPVGYQRAVAFMEERARLISCGQARELVWLLEHAALYTAGTSANPADLIDPERFPVHTTGRGGQYTYHGPGQRIGYVMLDLKARGGDVRAYVHQLEQWLIETLAVFGVAGEVRPDRVGVWVTHRDARGNKVEDKIAALGVRVSRGVSYHGVALNVAPDLAHFSGIVPCGISQYGVTSLAALGHRVSMSEVDAVLRTTFEGVFGVATVDASDADGT
ncbi:MAG: lipoyl(octanoyl) transferase LipB [Hyphomicrobiaceae bacterium]